MIVAQSRSIRPGRLFSRNVPLRRGSVSVMRPQWLLFGAMGKLVHGEGRKNAAAKAGPHAEIAKSSSQLSTHWRVTGWTGAFERRLSSLIAQSPSARRTIESVARSGLRTR